MKQLFSKKNLIKLGLVAVVVFAINWVGSHTMISYTFVTTQFYAYNSSFAPLDFQQGKWTSGLTRDEFYLLEDGWGGTLDAGYTLDGHIWHLVSGSIQQYSYPEYPDETQLKVYFKEVPGEDILDYFHGQ